MEAMKSEDPVLAKPSGLCCLQGVIHTGEPRGKFENVADVETYIVHPKSRTSNGHILLYFADVWGMFNNGLLIMDGFAEAGYTVLGLDYFRGVGSPYCF
jgi:dienelactone hydrolase